MIGSDDITLEMHLANRAEPAYLTSVVFIFPEGVILRSILPFCEEDPDGDNSIVICSIGNPFGINEQVSIIEIEHSSCQLNMCQD